MFFQPELNGLTDPSFHKISFLLFNHWIISSQILQLLSSLKNAKAKLEEKKLSIEQQREERKMLEAKNKERELDIRRQEADLKKVELKIWTIEQFREKWGE